MQAYFLEGLCRPNFSWAYAGLLSAEPMKTYRLPGVCRPTIWWAYQVYHPLDLCSPTFLLGLSRPLFAGPMQGCHLYMWVYAGLMSSESMQATV
jgi:hypothetical protein